jgi:hypothetical protein
MSVFLKKILVVVLFVMCSLNLECMETSDFSLKRTNCNIVKTFSSEALEYIDGLDKSFCDKNHIDFYGFSLVKERQESILHSLISDISANNVVNNLLLVAFVIASKNVVGNWGVDQYLSLIEREMPILRTRLNQWMLRGVVLENIGCENDSKIECASEHSYRSNCISIRVIFLLAERFWKDEFCDHGGFYQKIKGKITSWGYKI